MLDVLDEEQAKRARKRARKLLLAHLDDFQRRQYRRKGYFDVISSRGNVFRISDAFPFNVRLAGPAKASRVFFCMDAEDRSIPLEDVLLGQKLLLEADEGRFLSIATMAYIPKM